jgi:hypothetical protein
MKKIIKFEIECGEKTCASKPGEFCKFLSGYFLDMCILFDERLFENDDGWVARCKECLECGK